MKEPFKAMEKRSRLSYRLKFYDYTNNGIYFITICTDNKINHFGDINKEKMELNDLGSKAHEYWENIEKHYPDTILHNFIIMPNHIHGIIEISKDGISLLSQKKPSENNLLDNINTEYKIPKENIKSQFGKPKSGSISMIINQFKSNFKRWCNNNGYNQFKWQKRFHDHIIKNNKEYEKINKYINENPQNWNKEETNNNFSDL